MSGSSLLPGEVGPLHGETHPGEPFSLPALQGSGPSGSTLDAPSQQPQNSSTRRGPSAFLSSLPQNPHTLLPRVPTPGPATQAPEPHPPQETSHKLMTFVRPLRQMETFFYSGICCTQFSEALALYHLVLEEEPVLGEKWGGGW